MTKPFLQLKRDLGDRIIKEIRKELIVRDIPVGVADIPILDSWRYRIYRDTIHVWSEAPHARYVEYGRLPGSYPPYDAINKWVMKKLVLGQGLKGKEAEDIGKQLTWKVMRKIYLYGIEPQYFMRAVMERIERGKY